MAYGAQRDGGWRVIRAPSTSTAFRRSVFTVVLGEVRPADAPGAASTLGASRAICQVLGAEARVCFAFCAGVPWNAKRLLEVAVPLLATGRSFAQC